MGDYYGSISDHTKAIEINPKNHLAFSNRGISRALGFKDEEGACDDFKKASNLGNQYRKGWLQSPDGRWCRDMNSLIK